MRFRCLRLSSPSFPHAGPVSPDTNPKKLLRLAPLVLRLTANPTIGAQPAASKTMRAEEWPATLKDKELNMAKNTTTAKAASTRIGKGKVGIMPTGKK